MPENRVAYLELNDNQRELVGIKWRNGNILNNILTWAEQRGDETITDKQLEKMDKQLRADMVSMFEDMHKKYEINEAAVKNGLCDMDKQLQNTIGAVSRLSEKINKNKNKENNHSSLPYEINIKQ